MSDNVPRWRAQPYSTVLDVVGWTPLTRLDRVVDVDGDFEVVTRQLTGNHAAVIVARGGEPVGIITRFDVVYHLIGLGRATGMQG